jgi:pimeloyl-ACP methyl ester carboxylesterase
LEVPPPTSIDDINMGDGAMIRLRRYGKPGRTRLALSHGNGLAISAYAQFWLPLAPHFDLVVFDIRNHGENPLHQPQRHTWPVIFADFDEIFRGIQSCYGLAPTVGVFHSLSALAALNDELTRGPRWAALALFDPPIFPRPGHSLVSEELSDVVTLARRAKRRPETYQLPAAFAAQLRGKPAFARWNPEAFMLMAQHTLRPTRQGLWELRNPRELEAHIFESKVDADQWLRMNELQCPTILIGGDPDAPFAGPPARVCRAVHEEMGTPYISIPGTTHFLQLEEPDACREVLLSFLRRHALFDETTS